MNNTKHMVLYVVLLVIGLSGEQVLVVDVTVYISQPATVVTGFLHAVAMMVMRGCVLYRYLKWTMSCCHDTG